MASTADSASPPSTSTPASTASESPEEHQSDGSKLKTFITILKK
jgi:hypothetical protein